LSGNRWENTGGKGDITEMEIETGGTGLTTTQNYEFANEAKRKKKGHEIAARKAEEWKSRKE
jgi:hypothetical protein